MVANRLQNMSKAPLHYSLIITGHNFCHQLCLVVKNCNQFDQYCGKKIFDQIWQPFYDHYETTGHVMVSDTFDPLVTHLVDQHECMCSLQN